MECHIEEDCEFSFGQAEFEAVWSYDGGCLVGNWLYKPGTLKRDLAKTYRRHQHEGGD